MKLDALDRRILQELHKHARWPASKLAKACRTTREVVAYRMNKLEEEGVIKAYIAKINQTFFCQGVGTLLLRLQRTNQKRFKDIIRFLQKHPCVNWIAELCGTADITITVLYKNPEHLAHTVSEITEFVGEQLKTHNLSLYITEYKFSRRGVLSKEKTRIDKEKVVQFQGQQNEKLDAKDLVILGKLAQNCRIRNRELAKVTKLSEDAIRLRIRRLEKKNIVLGYTIVLDVNACGFESYLMQLQLENITQETSGKILAYVHKNSFIGYCARTAGRFNLVFSLYAQDRKHFNTLLHDIRETFVDELVDYEFQLNLQEHKEVFLPEAFIKQA